MRFSYAHKRVAALAAVGQPNHNAQVLSWPEYETKVDRAAPSENEDQPSQPTMGRVGPLHEEKRHVPGKIG